MTPRHSVPDVLKALCLGARAVGMGRPFLYAQSVSIRGPFHQTSEQSVMSDTYTGVRCGWRRSSGPHPPARDHTRNALTRRHQHRPAHTRIGAVSSFRARRPAHRASSRSNVLIGSRYSLVSEHASKYSGVVAALYLRRSTAALLRNGIRRLPCCPA